MGRVVTHATRRRVPWHTKDMCDLMQMAGEDYVACGEKRKENGI
jgi:hypothetical protein